MNSVLFWKLILWATPIVAGIIMLIANYNITKIEGNKEKTDVAKGDTYNIYSLNQSGGFNGVINNDFDKLKEVEAYDLLAAIQKTPSNYKAIYERLQLIGLPSNGFSKFKILLEFSKQMEAENRINNPSVPENGLSTYTDFRNKTMPLLLRYYAPEIYKDTSIDSEFNLRSHLQFFSNSERKKFIQILNETTNIHSYNMHKHAIKSMLIDLCSYSPELIPFFESTFGKKKIKLMKPLWEPNEIKDIDNNYRTLLLQVGII